MINILFFEYVFNSMQRDVCKELITVLRNDFRKVDVVSPDIALLKETYDIAIACNKQGYNNFRKLGLDIPLLYVLSSDDCWGEMIFDSSLYTHLLMINTNGTVYSNSFVTQISFPFMAINIAPNNKDRKCKRLLVDIGGADILMSLLPLLNMYVDCDIHILTSKPYRFKDIVNTHVNLSVEKNREKLIEEADILIAEGYTALKGVMQQKPVFVLGERGFGGLIEKENIKEQYRTGFSGRLGGVKGEYLPLPMVDYEIKKILNKRVEGLNETADALLESCRETSDKLCRLVSFFVNLSKRKRKVSLQKNRYMGYVHTDEGGAYWVVDKIYRKFLLEIDETEKVLVDCFETPRQLSSVYEEMKDKMSPEEIEKSVDDLLKYKLLDYCIYETAGTEL